MSWVTPLWSVTSSHHLGAMPGLDQNINQKPRNSPHSGRILPDAGSSNFPEARSAASELRYAYGGTKQALYCVVIILTELKRSQGWSLHLCTICIQRDGFTTLNSKNVLRPLSLLAIDHRSCSTPVLNGNGGHFTSNGYIFLQGINILL